MKNLKKVLSLALVFAMVLGLCIGAMAAETQDVTTLADWGNVTHKEAAQLLNAFNIMQGYTDKTFRPSNTVTRAEAVKMIDVGLWGGVDQADRFIGSEIAFSDVKSGDWYAGHVVYAEALGILDGFPDGTFRPNDTVTGYQMLKMALIALNYNSEVEGLTGAGWDIRTMRLATDPSAGANSSLTNLTAGLGEITDWNAPLTRDQAAQIIANMIMHSYVTYSLTNNGQVGNVKEYETGTFGEVYLDLSTGKGVLAANQYGSVTKGFAVNPATMNTYAVAIDPVDDDNCIIADEDVENVLIAPVTFTTNGTTTATAGNLIKATLTSTIEDLGTPVTIYYKDKAPIAVSIDSKTEVEPAYNADASKVTNADREKGEVAPTDLTVTYNYETTGSTQPKPVIDKGAYTDTTAYDVDGDGRVDFMATKTFSAPTEVRAVSSTTKHGDVYQVGGVAWRSSYENSDLNSTRFLAAEDASFTAAKGDIIAYNTLVTAYGEVASYGIVLDAVEGKIDRVNKNTPNAWYIHVDGVQYFLEGIDAPDFGSEGTAYTYPDGKVGLWVNKTTAPDATKYAVIYDAGWDVSGNTTSIGGKQNVNVQVSAILDTGDTGVYNVAGINIPGINNYVEDSDSATGYSRAPSTYVPVSAFSADTIISSATIAVTNHVGKPSTDTVTGFFNKDSGVLFDVDNTKYPTDVTGKVIEGAESEQEYRLVTYTVNEDGSLNLTVLANTGTGVESIGKDATIKAGSPSLGNKSYFKSSTLTFTQTYEKKAADENDVTAETWTVVTGLPTADIKIADTYEAEAYTAKYFSPATTTTDDYSAVAFVLTYGDVESKASTLPFLYVINNNGRSGTYNNDPVYLLDIYNAETDKIEQIETIDNVSAGSFYTGYNATDKSMGTKITLSLESTGETTTTPNVGFITSIADNVIGLTKVEKYTEKNGDSYDKRVTDTKAFVITNDTKYYIIDGDQTAKTDLGGIGTQEVLDWADRAGNKNKGEDEIVTLGTHYYQTAIIPTKDNGNIAAYVIVFASEQGQDYKACTDGNNPGVAR